MTYASNDVNNIKRIDTKVTDQTVEITYLNRKGKVIGELLLSLELFQGVNIPGAKAGFYSTMDPIFKNVAPFLQTMFKIPPEKDSRVLNGFIPRKFYVDDFYETNLVTGPEEWAYYPNPDNIYEEALVSDLTECHWVLRIGDGEANICYVFDDDASGMNMSPCSSLVIAKSIGVDSTVISDNGLLPKLIFNVKERVIKRTTSLRLDFAKFRGFYNPTIDPGWLDADKVFFDEEDENREVWQETLKLLSFEKTSLGIPYPIKSVRFTSSKESIEAKESHSVLYDYTFCQN